VAIDSLELQILIVEVLLRAIHAQARKISGASQDTLHDIDISCCKQNVDTSGQQKAFFKDEICF
jgi:hypothetical protein